MEKSELPLNVQLLIVKTESMICKKILDAENPAQTYIELTNNVPSDLNVDVKTFYGSHESLIQIAEEYSEKGYTGVLKNNQEDEKDCSLVVSSITPIDLETEDEQFVRVFRATPASLAPGLILVAAPNLSEAIELIRDLVVTNVEHLNIFEDSDYDEITGESRILEVIGFDLN